ncbi:MAG: DUF2764 domain-containing protein [Treponema sp.]|nr:DUF2764 domain-containing protein [Treponema sp.]
MGAYYYLGAQLPYLVYGQGPSMSSEAFKALAREQMSSSDGALLEVCTLDPEPLAEVPEDMAEAEEAEQLPSYANLPPRTSSSLLNYWRKWERLLRLNLARGRALKLKLEAPEAPESPPEISAAVQQALTIESPLDAELYLDKARWDAIDSFLGNDIFSENAIYGYLLKLLLMERRASFDAEQGYKEYEGLYAAILGSKNLS